MAEQVQCNPATGLDDDPADLQRRRDAFGANVLPEPKPKQLVELALEALDDFTLKVLMAAGALSFVLWYQFENGQGTGWVDGVAILAAVFVVVAVSATTNYQRDLQFRELAATERNVQVRVRRGGEARSISVTELVVGDVLLLTAGDIVAADGLLLDGFDVRCDESHLTGEPDDLLKAPDGDCAVFSGSKVTSGYGSVLVLAVGLRSQQGKIMRMTQQGALQSPGEAAEREYVRSKAVLEDKLEDLAGKIGRLGAVAAALTFGIQLAFSAASRVQGGGFDLEYSREVVDYVINAVTVLVVAVPEGLPLAVTMALAFSVRKMLSDNNLVRHLYACETMATCTSIASDKTGTLTQNVMRVSRVWVAGAQADHIPGMSPEDLLDPDVAHLPGEVASLSSVVLDAFKTGIAVNSTASLLADPADPRSPGGPLRLTEIGNRTECALLRFACSLGTDVPAERAASVIVAAQPFSSERKRMSVLVQRPAAAAAAEGAGAPAKAEFTLFCKGAAEIMLERCTTQLGPDGGVLPLDAAQKAALLQDGRVGGLRLVVLAFRDIHPPSSAAPGANGTAAAAGNGAAGGDAYALAVQSGQSGVAAVALEAELTLVGVVGIRDRVRPEAPEAVRRCQEAGITVRMLTGDHRSTAAVVARECGILSGDIATATPFVTRKAGSPGNNGARSGAAEAPNPDAVIATLPAAAGPAGGEDALTAPEGACVVRGAGGGEELVMDGEVFRRAVLRPDNSIDQAAFNALWPRLRVLARCTPMDKFAIIQGCQGYRLPDGRRDIVAMTGDGTNDAPALRLADVGFAMRSGTSVARQASDIILMDDNFNSIVQSVKWGRNVYASIIKFLQFQLTINVVAVVTAIVGVSFLHKSPLTPVQMLWVNMIMDSLASLSLATENPSAMLLEMPPFSSSASLLTPIATKHIVGQVCYQLFVMGVLIALPDEALGVSPAEHMTVIFNSFVVIQLFNQIACRKAFDEADIFENLLDNRIFLGVLSAEAVLQILIVQFGGAVFNTVPLPPQMWLLSLGLGALSWLVRQSLLLIPTPKFDLPRGRE